MGQNAGQLHRVVGGVTGHGQNFPGPDIKGHGRTGPGLGITLGERCPGCFLQRGFCRLLNPAVNSQDQIITGHRVLYTQIPYRPGHGIHFNLPAAILAAQVRFIGVLQAGLAKGVVKPVTLIFVFFQLPGVNLPDITHNIGQDNPVGILPLGFYINIYTRQFQTLFFDPGHNFGGNPVSNLHWLVETTLIVYFFLNFSRVKTQNGSESLDNTAGILLFQID
ncbi:MAG: hypothetical protein BWY80_00539 [Firmicutes bacterium ADurb.Bin456]|nr:MAG: hypothetical protein BWY80_00539 [Firmicutes bacterium ADurb.Bin456]